MKLLVTIKRVPDPDTRVRVRPDGGGIVTDGVKFGVNPFDAIAMEEAQRIRESKGNIEIVAVGIGREESVEQLQTALAMGADRALLGELTSDSAAQVRRPGC